MGRKVITLANCLYSALFKYLLELSHANELGCALRSKLVNASFRVYYHDCLSFFFHCDSVYSIRYIGQNSKVFVISKNQS